MSEIIDIDFETFSAAGLYQDIDGKWKPLQKGKSGIECVGAAAYAMHSSTRIMCLVYGDKLWIPAMPPPHDLLKHVIDGGLIRAHNSAFEFFIWNCVGCKLHAWPPLKLEQLVCTAAASRSHSLPGSLEGSAAALGVGQQKDKKGGEVMRRVSVPGRDPSAADLVALYMYCQQDVNAQRDIARRLPPYDRALWLLDQKINTTGITVDVESINKLIAIYKKLEAAALPKIKHLTGGVVEDYNKVNQLKKWLGITSLTADNVDDLLADPKLTDVQKEVLKIRQQMGGAAVKKLFSLKNYTCPDNRVRDLFVFCGADRTGRWAGRGPQPQNFPAGCSIDNLDIERVLSGDVSAYPGQEIEAISGSLRGLFIAGPGHNLIASDFSSIEAVVLAMVAGEQWRVEVFRTHGKIYEMSAGKICGIPFEEFLRHKKETGEHHPMRKAVGKVAELASGYQGGIEAWKNFGADAFMTDQEIRDNIKKWRAESPAIVKFWYGVEEAALCAASSNIGEKFKHRDMVFFKRDQVLYCRLPSGRHLRYHQPYIGVSKFGKPALYFYENGKTGWSPQDTYGGKLTENIVQAVSRDILAAAMLRLDKAGYDIRLTVHDEIVSEVKEGFGSVGEFERIMCDHPDWCKDWPIKAAGGWVGKRYKK